jgi:hypothetical protein
MGEGGGGHPLFSFVSLLFFWMKAVQRKEDILREDKFSKINLRGVTHP